MFKSFHFCFGVVKFISRKLDFCWINKTGLFLKRLDNIAAHSVDPNANLSEVYLDNCTVTEMVKHPVVKYKRLPVKNYHVSAKYLCFNAGFLL